MTDFWLTCNFLETYLPYKHKSKWRVKTFQKRYTYTFSITLGMPSITRKLVVSLQLHLFHLIIWAYSKCIRKASNKALIIGVYPFDGDYLDWFLWVNNQPTLWRIQSSKSMQQEAIFRLKTRWGKHWKTVIIPSWVSNGRRTNFNSLQLKNKDKQDRQWRLVLRVLKMNLQCNIFSLNICNRSFLRKLEVSQINRALRDCRIFYEFVLLTVSIQKECLWYI